MQLARRYIYSLFLATVCGHQAVAAPPPGGAFVWPDSLVIDSGYVVSDSQVDALPSPGGGTVVSDSQYIAPDVESQTDVGFQIQIVNELACPAEHVCGDPVTGPTFLQKEFTDGANIWFRTRDTNGAASSAVTTASTWDSTPFHLFDVEDGVVLKPGKHLVNILADTLASQPTNLHIERDQLTVDPDYIELNQQSAAEQVLYQKVIDAELELTGATIGAEVMLSAQLNVPLSIPSSFELRMRVLSDDGWTDFVSNERNDLAAATKLDTGYCPEVSSILYQDVFTAGAECLRITLQDGGPNDSDGSENGSVAITIGAILRFAQSSQEVDQALQVTQSSQEVDQTLPANGGGGVWSLWWFCVVLFRLQRLSRKV